MVQGHRPIDQHVWTFVCRPMLTVLRNIGTSVDYRVLISKQGEVTTQLVLMLTLTTTLTLTSTLILTLTLLLTLTLILTLNCYNAFPTAPSKLYSSRNIF